MARDQIPPDSTLADIVGSLANPEGTVRKVLTKLGYCKQEHGNAHVRIGVTGEGKAPYYKIFHRGEEGAETHFGTFYGERQDESFNAQKGAWSARSMSHDEVMQLIGEIRGYRQTGKTNA